MKNKIQLDFVFRVIGMALGIAVFVLNILGEISVKDATNLLALGIILVSLSLIIK